MIVASYISPKAAKGRRSAIEGRGLVAVTPIGTDEIVAVGAYRAAGHSPDEAAAAALASSASPARSPRRSVPNWVVAGRVTSPSP